MSTNLSVSDVAFVQVGSNANYALTADRPIYVKVATLSPTNMASKLITVAPRPDGFLPVGPCGSDPDTCCGADPVFSNDAAPPVQLSLNAVAISVPAGKSLWAR